MIDESSPLDVLLEDFATRHRRGERPTIDEYASAHPHHAAEIRELFPTLIAIENLKVSPVPTGQLIKPSWNNPPVRVGDCRIICEIGRGGMGVVYEAEQESLRRRVAVKMLPEELVSSDQQLQRFLRESRNTARLHHSNIVSVFGVGYEDGFHYFVMQYIVGMGLDKLLPELRNRIAPSDPAPSDPAPIDSATADRVTDRPQTTTGNSAASTSKIVARWSDGLAKGKGAHEVRYWRRVATLGLQVAEALDYAHGHGIVHRDIKPANLLIDEYGTAWVTDFGLAKTLSPSGSQPNRDIVGTIRYMAPEQFQGDCRPLCDVYSLGLTLYEFLTHRPAYVEQDVVKLVYAITNTHPPRPRELCSTIPRDLEAIVLKAMARDPHRRYATAKAMADDLRSYIEGKPVCARRMSSPERFRKWVKRNPAIATLSGVLVGTLILGVSVVSSQWRKAERERQRAESNLTLALDAMDETLNSFAATWMAHPTAPQSDDDRQDVEIRIIASPNSALIMQRALKFYNQFTAENASNPRLRRDTATAYHHVADIRQRLGHLQEAETAYRAALEIYAELQKTLLDDQSLVHEAAVAWNDLGDALSGTSRSKDTLAAYSSARDLLENVVKQDPISTACRFELARSYNSLGAIMSRLGRWQIGRQNQQRAQQLLDELVSEDPENPDYLLAHARCCISQSRSIASAGSAAATPFLRGIALKNLELLVEKYPDVPDYKCEFVETLNSVAIRPPRNGDSSKHEETLRRALALGRELYAEYPAIPRYRAALARTLHWLGLSLSNQRKLQDALEIQREAADLYTDLAEEFHRVAGYQNYAAWSSAALGDGLRQNGQFPESRTALEEAISRQETYLKLRPDDWAGDRVLSRYYQSLSETLKRLGENALAKKAEETATRLAAKHRGPPRSNSSSPAGKST